MRRAKVFLNDRFAGILSEEEKGRRYRFEYDSGYDGDPISRTMQVGEKCFEWDRFPPFFDGLLPEGLQLEALLRQNKIDRDDCFSQLVVVGADTVGAATVSEIATDKDQRGGP